MMQRAGQESSGSVVGCRFGNLALEPSNQHEDVRRRLQEIFEAQIDMVGQVVVAARSIVAQLEGLVLFETMWRHCLAPPGATAEARPTEDRTPSTG